MLDFKKINKNDKNKNHKFFKIGDFYSWYHPIFIIVFIFFTIFLFIFGDNGYYSHKDKINKIQNLTFNNKKISDKVLKLIHINRIFKNFNHFLLEKEARIIPLKKEGDVIIKIPDQKWLNKLANLYQIQINMNFQKKPHFMEKNKVFLIIIAIILLISYIIFFYPKRKKN